MLVSLQPCNTVVGVAAKVEGVVALAKDEVTEVTEVVVEVPEVPHEAEATKVVVSKMFKQTVRTRVRVVGADTPDTEHSVMLTLRLSSPAGAIGRMGKELISVKSHRHVRGRTSGSPSRTPNETGTSLERKMTRTR